MAVASLLYLGCLVTCAQVFDNPFKYGADLEPNNRLSGVGRRDAPPDYGPPNYSYGSPPPYEYETSSSTSTLTTASDSSTCEYFHHDNTQYKTN